MMMKKIASAVASAALLLNLVAAPALATISVELTGNGVESKNTADIDVDQTRTVVQDNNAYIKTKVNATADSGDNEANKNNGGMVEIDTGDADVLVDVKNDVNKNHAELDCCGAGDVDVKIDGNAADTENKIKLDQDNTTEMFQDNDGKVYNDVVGRAYSGNNEANKNNGGDVEIKTGDTLVDMFITTSGNANSAKMTGPDEGSSLSAWIVRNAAETDNEIDLDLDNGTLLTQDNNMKVDNDVRGTSRSDRNEANKNNGGNVEIDTGDATVIVDVDNAVNFNWADVECDCLVSDLFAKVADNAYDSENKITLDLVDNLDVFQDNCGKDGDNKTRRRHRRGDCGVDNMVNAAAASGQNEADKNNGDHDSDPSIETGDAYTDVIVDNEGNENVFGSAPDWDFDLNGVSLNLTLDLAALLGL